MGALRYGQSTPTYIATVARIRQGTHGTQPTYDFFLPNLCRTLRGRASAGAWERRIARRRRQRDLAADARRRNRV